SLDWPPTYGSASLTKTRLRAERESSPTPPALSALLSRLTTCQFVKAAAAPAWRHPPFVRYCEAAPTDPRGGSRFPVSTPQGIGLRTSRGTHRTARRIRGIGVSLSVR